MKRFLIVSLIFIQFVSLKADEGLWYPLLNSGLYAKMKEMGLELTLNDIGNNGKGISNAVIQFNNGCTGVIVSKEGLFITNFHCCKTGMLSCVSGYKNMNSFTGFWASSKSNEIPMPNLSIRQLTEVKYIPKDSIDYFRNKNCSFDCVINQTYTDDKYIMYVYQTFTDIRLVAAPSAGLGRLGGDSANWAWPRYSADFAMFRIYSNAQNQPAEYSKENVPHTPESFIPVSTNGYSEGDLSLVLGYPGSGSPCELSDFLSLMSQKSYPLRSEFYLAKIESLRKMITLNPALEKVQGNSLKGLLNREKMWALMLGEMNCSQVIAARRDWELRLLKLAHTDSLQNELKKIQSTLSKKYEQMGEYSDAYDFHREGFDFISMFSICNQVTELCKNENGLKTVSSIPGMTEKMKLFYENFDSRIDKELFVKIMNLYDSVICHSKQIPYILKYSRNIGQWGEYLYTHSVFSSYDMLKQVTVQNVMQDSLTVLIKEVENYYNDNIWPNLTKVSNLNYSY